MGSPSRAASAVMEGTAGLLIQSEERDGVLAHHFALLFQGDTRGVHLLVHYFKGVRPAADLVREVVAPQDVVNADVVAQTHADGIIEEAPVSVVPHVVARPLLQLL